MLIQAYCKPHQGRSHSHWWNQWLARRYHHNWRSSSHSHSRNVRHNKLQKCTRMSTWASHVLMPPESPTEGGTPLKPPTEGKIPIWYTDIPKTYWCTGKPKTHWGATEGEAPPYGGRCNRSIQHVRGPLTIPTTCRSLWEHTDAEEYGEHMGVYTPGGIWMYGVYECMEVYEHRGHPDTPK